MSHVQLVFPKMPRAHSANSHQPKATRVSCGVLAGLMATAALNPWDRALYLSVLHRRPFLQRANFQHPYQGFFQTVAQRSISSGLYFPLEHIFVETVGVVFDSSHVTFLVAGCFAGAANAILLNPLAFIKYHSWSSPNCYDFKSSRERILKNQGLRGFYRGAWSTVLRDVIFGGVFSLRNTPSTPRASELTDLGLPSHLSLRNSRETETVTRRLCVNFTSCCLATFLSSPLNFVRNIQYGTSTTQSVEGIVPILRGLWRENQRIGSRLDRAQHLQQRLRLGWGTARVSFGMALTDLLYRRLCDTLL